MKSGLKWAVKINDFIDSGFTARKASLDDRRKLLKCSKVGYTNGVLGWGVFMCIIVSLILD